MTTRKALYVKLVKTCLVAAVAAGAAILALAGPSAATAKSSPNAVFAGAQGYGPADFKVKLSGGDVG